MKKCIASLFQDPAWQRPLVLWLIILASELSYLLFLNHNRLIPLFIDGFQYFHVQYYFLNHQIIHGEMPFWIP
ncbi:MAG: hypothetical protein Q7T18_11120, partial [Sedimentisphaerales bacterium]|nr:hypothetical protein [Sedimentisphaerales bacterium]